VNEISAGVWQPDRHGMLPAPASRGLGVELDAVAEYTPGEPLLRQSGCASPE